MLNCPQFRVMQDHMAVEFPVLSSQIEQVSHIRTQRFQNQQPIPRPFESSVRASSTIRNYAGDNLWGQPFTTDDSLEAIKQHATDSFPIPDASLADINRSQHSAYKSTVSREHVDNFKDGRNEVKSSWHPNDTTGTTHCPSLTSNTMLVDSELHTSSYTCSVDSSPDTIYSGLYSPERSVAHPADIDAHSLWNGYYEDQHWGCTNRAYFSKEDGWPTIHNSSWTGNGSNCRNPGFGTSGTQQVSIPTSTSFVPHDSWQNTVGTDLTQYNNWLRSMAQQTGIDDTTDRSLLHADAASVSSASAVANSRTVSQQGNAHTEEATSMYASLMGAPQQFERDDGIQQTKGRSDSRFWDNSHASHGSQDRKMDDKILLEGKRAGLTYKEIRKRMCTKVAESTLRGRHRALTKARKDRVRKPLWTERDVHLLKDIVCYELGQLDVACSRAFASNGQKLGKIPWKKVADYIHENGGSYHFGNSTCKKKWCNINSER